MNLSLGFSSCPNDTFIFDALVNNRIEHPFNFELTIADIKQLNELGFSASLDVIKLSYHALAFMLDDYQILDCGSALGRGVGPLLISKEEISINENMRVGIPGEYTTANFLLKFSYPKLRNRQTLLFSEIEDALLKGTIDLGVIIHESRFTYKNKGLHLIADLGNLWEQQTKYPIPLGAIAIKRSLPEVVKVEFQKMLKASIIYARANPLASSDYIRGYAKELEPDVVNQHINLYVNDYTVSLGADGRETIKYLIEKLSPGNKSNLFV